MEIDLKKAKRIIKNLEGINQLLADIETALERGNFTLRVYDSEGLCVLELREGKASGASRDLLNKRKEDLLKIKEELENELKNL